MGEDKKKTNKLMDNLFKLPFLKKLKNVKHIEIIVCIIFISILVLIYFVSFNKTTSQTSSNSVINTGELSFTSSSVYAKEMEEKLTRVITNLEGVNSVSVMVSVASGSEIVIANSIEEEKIYSSSGESENVTTIKTPIIVTQNGTSKPIILMEVLPKIEGVVVVAGGANDVKVKLNIYRVVQAMVDISSENIQVFAGK